MSKSTFKRKVKEILKDLIERVSSNYNEHPIIFGFIRLVLSGGPALTFSYAVVKIGENPILFQTELRQWFSTHPVWVYVLLGWTLIFNILEQTVGRVIVAYREKYSLKAFELTALVSAIDQVVGYKLERFGKFSATECKSANEAFLSITQPTSQIEYLISNLSVLLRTLTNDDSLKIVLAKMDNNVPIGWETFMPDDVHPDDSLLNQNRREKTLFSKCAVENKPKWIEDISRYLSETEEEKREFLKSRNPANSGSIVCYPILHNHSNNVIYALSIKSNKPKFIGEQFVEKYDYIVQRFITRIKLEYSLFLIKAKVGS